MDFYQAWIYIQNQVDEFIYPLNHYLEVNVVRVNPTNLEIDDDDNLNTKTRVWLEFGFDEQGESCHDWDYDCGGDTFEEAIINLANLVKDKLENPNFNFKGIEYLLSLED